MALRALVVGKTTNGKGHTVKTIRGQLLVEDATTNETAWERILECLIKWSSNGFTTVDNKRSAGFTISG